MIALQGVEEDSCSPEDKQRSQCNREERLDSTVKRELLCHLGKVIDDERHRYGLCSPG